MHNGTAIEFRFLKTGKGRFLSPHDEGSGGKDSSGSGVGIVAGRDDLAVLAWSDAGPAPDVHVYQYLLPSQGVDLKGDATLEYLALAFNQDVYLIGLSGVPDFKLTLWHWPRGEAVYSISSGLAVGKSCSLPIIFLQPMYTTSLLQSTNVRLSFSPVLPSSSGPVSSKLVLIETGGYFIRAPNSIALCHFSRRL